MPTTAVVALVTGLVETSGAIDAAPRSMGIMSIVPLFAVVDFVSEIVRYR